VGRPVLAEHDPIGIEKPVTVEAAGNVPKGIEEFIGGASTGTTDISIAHMASPAGWEEPGQRPDFDEYTVVLTGRLVVEHADGRMEVRGGHAVHARPGEWVRYSSPEPEGADYISVCLPAFSPDIGHRDA
jgi:mannose-6-phosphate isomerase-like protein (cupin superfamily)